MITLTVSEKERAEGKLSVATIAEAKRAIVEDGFVVLDRVVDPSHVAAIRDAMLADAQRRIAAGNIRENRHIMQHPPRATELLFEDVFANPFALDVAEAVIGPRITCGFYESNTTLPGSTGQELHTDMRPREVEDSTQHACNNMVLNIPLIDFTVENGATEVWPGTHFVPTEIGTRWVSHALQDSRRQVRGEERATMRAGSMLLRDIRLWHRGVPNRSDEIRTMVAMIINGGFNPDTDDISAIPPLGTFSESARPLFERLRVVTNPTYVPDDLFAEPNA